MSMSELDAQIFEQRSIIDDHARSPKERAGATVQLQLLETAREDLSRRLGVMNRPRA